MLWDRHCWSICSGTYLSISLYKILKYNKFFFNFPGIFEVPRGLETVFSPFERKARRSWSWSAVCSSECDLWISAEKPAKLFELSSNLFQADDHFSKQLDAHKNYQTFRSSDTFRTPVRQENDWTFDQFDPQYFSHVTALWVH